MVLRGFSTVDLCRLTLGFSAFPVPPVLALQNRYLARFLTSGSVLGVAIVEFLSTGQGFPAYVSTYIRLLVWSQKQFRFSPPVPPTPSAPKCFGLSLK